MSILFFDRVPSKNQMDPQGDLISGEKKNAGDQIDDSSKNQKDLSSGKICLEQKSPLQVIDEALQGCTEKEIYSFVYISIRNEFVAKQKKRSKRTPSPEPTPAPKPTSFSTKTIEGTRQGKEGTSVESSSGNSNKSPKTNLGDSSGNQPENPILAQSSTSLSGKLVEDRSLEETAVSQDASPSEKSSSQPDFPVESTSKKRKSVLEVTSTHSKKMRSAGLKTTGLDSPSKSPDVQDKTEDDVGVRKVQDCNFNLGSAIANHLEGSSPTQYTKILFAYEDWLIQSLLVLKFHRFMIQGSQSHAVEGYSWHPSQLLESFNEKDPSFDCLSKLSNAMNSMFGVLINENMPSDPIDFSETTTIPDCLAYGFPQFKVHLSADTSNIHRFSFC